MARTQLLELAFVSLASARLATLRSPRDHGVIGGVKEANGRRGPGELSQVQLTGDDSSRQQITCKNRNASVRQKQRSFRRLVPSPSPAQPSPAHDPRLHLCQPTRPVLVLARHAPETKKYEQYPDVTCALHQRDGSDVP